MNITPEARIPHGSAGERYVIAAERVSDSTRMLEYHTVAISGDRIETMTPTDRLRDEMHLIHFADTRLPGFIDLHAHLLLDQTPQEIILGHGLTTVRDTGGNGRLRVPGPGRSSPHPVAIPSRSLAVTTLPVK